MFICKDDGCSALNEEVGSEEWEKEMINSGICEEDIKSIKEIIDYHRLRNQETDQDCEQRELTFELFKELLRNDKEKKNDSEVRRNEKEVDF